MATQPPYHPPPQYQQPPQYRQPAQPQHYPEAVFVNMPPSGKETSVNRINMPVVMAISGAVFLMGITYVATQQFAELKFAIEKLTSKMDTLASDLAGRIARLEQASGERWSKSDQEYWCVRTEHVNAGNGWRCAELPGERRREPVAPAQPAPAPPASSWRPVTK